MREFDISLTKDNLRDILNDDFGEEYCLVEKEPIGTERAGTTWQAIFSYQPDKTSELSYFQFEYVRSSNAGIVWVGELVRVYPKEITTTIYVRKETP